MKNNNRVFAKWKYDDVESSPQFSNDWTLMCVCVTVFAFLPADLVVYLFIFHFFSPPLPCACVWSDTVHIGEIMRGVLPSVCRRVHRDRLYGDDGAYESVADAAWVRLQCPRPLVYLFHRFVQWNRRSSRRSWSCQCQRPAATGRNRSYHRSDSRSRYIRILIRF